MAYPDDEEHKAKRKVYMQKWSKSEKGKAWRAAYIKKWEAKNGPYRAAYKKKMQRHFYYRFTHGISEADYDKIRDAQGGLCAICLLPPSGRGPAARLAIDHDHETKKIRELLCVNCNAGLGNFKDNIDRLKAAIGYLEKHSAHTAV